MERCLTSTQLRNCVNVVQNRNRTAFYVARRTKISHPKNNDRRVLTEQLLRDFVGVAPRRRDHHLLLEAEVPSRSNFSHLAYALCGKNDADPHEHVTF